MMILFIHEPFAKSADRAPTAMQPWHVQLLLPWLDCIEDWPCLAAVCRTFRPVVHRGRPTSIRINTHVAKTRRFLETPHCVARLDSWKARLVRLEVCLAAQRTLSHEARSALIHLSRAPGLVAMQLQMVNPQASPPSPGVREQFRAMLATPIRLQSLSLLDVPLCAASGNWWDFQPTTLRHLTLHGLRPGTWPTFPRLHSLSLSLDGALDVDRANRMLRDIALHRSPWPRLQHLTLVVKGDGEVDRQALDEAINEQLMCCTLQLIQRRQTIEREWIEKEYDESMEHETVTTFAPVSLASALWQCLLRALCDT